MELKYKKFNILLVRLRLNLLIILIIIKAKMMKLF